jgi:hypothetical protein
MESGEGKGADFLDGCQQSYMKLNSFERRQILCYTCRLNG